MVKGQFGIFFLKSLLIILIHSICMVFNIWQCLENFGLSRPWGMGTTGIWCAEAGDGANILTFTGQLPKAVKLLTPKCK